MPPNVQGYTATYAFKTEDLVFTGSSVLSFPGIPEISVAFPIFSLQLTTTISLENRDPVFAVLCAAFYHHDL